MKDVAYMTGEAWEQVKAESISKVWCKTLLNRVDQVNGAEASSERVSSEEQEGETAALLSAEVRHAGAEASSERVFCEEPEGESDAAQLSAELTHAGFPSVDEADIKEWLNVNRNEPGHTALTEEEIVQVVSRPDEEDEEVERRTDRRRTCHSFPQRGLCISINLYTMAGGTSRL